MKFRMAEKSIFAMLLRSPWWVSVLLAGAMALFAKASLPDHLFALGAMGGFPFLVIAVLAARRQLKAPSPARVQQTLDAVRAMSWPDFAAVLEGGWQREGYRVSRRGAKETGADFAIEKAGVVTLVSCKRWKAANLGLEPLRELRAAMEKADAGGGICIALGDITAQASSFAREQGIQLAQAADVARMLWRTALR